MNRHTLFVYSKLKSLFQYSPEKTPVLTREYWSFLA